LPSPTLAGAGGPASPAAAAVGERGACCLPSSAVEDRLVERDLGRGQLAVELLHRAWSDDRRFMTHIAIQEIDESGSPVTWGDPVDDATYLAAPAA
jgi:hypothetical protein